MVTPCWRAGEEATVSGFMSRTDEAEGISDRGEGGLRATGLLVVALVVGLIVAGLAMGHEGTRRRPVAQGSIDPAESFQFLAVSGAGGHFHTLLPLPEREILLAGTHIGLFRSEDRGLNWRLAAARFSGEDVHALAFDPTTRTLYAATHRQGLLLSRDGGRRWSDHSQGLPGRDVHALALDPREPHTLYAWVVGHGLLRSDDGGHRWRRVTGSDVLSGVESLAVHPRESGRLYAGTAKGVWLSEDAGHQWRFPAGGLPHRTAGVSVTPRRPDLLFAATLEGAFVGKADGTDWKPLSPHPRWWGVITGFAFLSWRPEVVLAVTHEGVVTARRLAGGEWAPVAELLNSDWNARRK